MLNVQYRMHPEIRQFPSKYFYEDKLLDGDNVKSEYYSLFATSDTRFRPFIFYDVRSRERRAGNSYTNETEAKWCVSIFQELKKTFSDIQVCAILNVISV